MDQDEDFARTLRGRFDSAMPRIDVDTTQVVPRARRRRATARSAGALALTVVLAGGGWAVQARSWSPSLAAAPTATGSATATAGPTGPASAAPTASPTVAATGTHWYTLITSTGADGVHRDESWVSRELPGLLVTDGDLSTASGIGPRNVLGSFSIDGVWVEMLRDPARLPTDPTALEGVLRASVQPDRRAGTDDDKVFGMALDLLVDGGLLPDDLRRAAWAVAADLPAAQASTGTDSTGRPGEIVEYSQDGAVVRLVRDASTGLLLEKVTPDATRTYTEQRPSSDLPVEPTLENSGCASWESC